MIISLLMLIFLTILLIIAIGFRFIRNIFLSIFSPKPKEQEIKRPEQPETKDELKVGDLSDAKEVEFTKE